jgi:hypothetical protein
MPLLILQAKAPLEPRDDRTLVAVSQVFNLHRDRIYLHRLASLSGLQDEILRYSKICATFRFGAQKKHLRNPGYPRLSS